MKILEFRGSSDDTFGFDIFDCRHKRLAGDDHDDCAQMTVRAFSVSSKSTGDAIVTGVYGKSPTAVWSIGISPLDENVILPDWASRPYFRTEGYTPVLALTVPDDTEVKLVCVDGEPPK